MSKVKKVSLGTFYGEKVFIEDTRNLLSEKEWQNKWQEWLKKEKEETIRDQGSKSFIKELEEYQKILT